MATDDHVEDEFIPRIVVLGAGPIGLEATLYARYLGYEVAVLEKGRIANNVLDWGHVKMFSPFSMNRSALGLAALKAQRAAMKLPADDALLTGKEFAESYLLPLSQSDLLAGCIHENVEVLCVGRDGILRTDMRGIDRSEYRFRIFVLTEEGENVVEADVVIDATGVFNQPNYLGHGGIPAPGELACRQRIVSRLPDVLGTQRERFANRRVLVVGGGYSAATNVVALADLHQEAKETKTTWITRRESSPDGPLKLVENDLLSHRVELSRLANQTANTAADGVQHFDQTSVIKMVQDGPTDPFTVTLVGKLHGDHIFDEIIASVGFHPNRDIFRELQVDESSTGQGTAKLAAWLKSLGPIDALEQDSPGVDALINDEPNFFVLGSKSFGRNSNFLLSVGLKQVREIFTRIAGREELDLYATMEDLAR